MESIEIEGTSIEEAVERACDALNTNQENLQYEIVSQKEGRNSKVKIVARKREESEEVAMSDFAKKMKETLADMIKMIAPEHTVAAYEYPDKLVLNIKGDGSGLLIGKRGQTLDAIQHLLIKIAQKEADFNSSKKIIVDTEKYREKRIEYLKDLARKLADKVRKTGKSLSVNPMSSFERRIIHITLDQVEGIYTESQGEGSERKVVILPKGKGNRVGYGSKNRA